MIFLIQENHSYRELERITKIGNTEPAYILKS